MNLTEEQLKAIEDLAYRMITPELIALKIEVDPYDFIDEIKNKSTESSRAFYKGYITQLIETRESIIKSAQNGSNPAQMELLKFINEMQNHIR